MLAGKFSTAGRASQVGFIFDPFIKALLMEFMEAIELGNYCSSCQILKAETAVIIFIPICWLMRNIA
jgi:hypothetical protein